MKMPWSQNALAQKKTLHSIEQGEMRNWEAATVNIL